MIRLKTEQPVKARPGVKNDVILSIAAMFRFCCRMGIALPESMFQDYNDIVQHQTRLDKGEADPRPENGRKDLEELARIFNSLSTRVAPARPGTIYLMDKSTQPVPFWRYLLELRFLGPIMIVRQLMVAALVALILFLGLSLSESINAANMAKSIFELSGGTLACNLLFLVSAASLGAAFAALFDLKTYIVQRNYDSVYETDYWIRFFLGVISGILMAELIPVDLWMGAGSGQNDPATAVQGVTTIPTLTRPVLAMLGGFSVKAFYQILKRIVNTLETLIQGKTGEGSADPRVELNNRLDSQKLKSKTMLLTEMTKIQQLVIQGESVETIQAEIDSIMERINSYDV